MRRIFLIESEQVITIIDYLVACEFFLDCEVALVENPSELDPDLLTSDDIVVYYNQDIEDMASPAGFMCSSITSEYRIGARQGKIPKLLQNLGAILLALDSFERLRPNMLYLDKQTGIYIASSIQSSWQICKLIKMAMRRPLPKPKVDAKIVA